MGRRGLKSHRIHPLVSPNPSPFWQVTDAAGNDITDARPTYKVQEGAWGAPEDDKEEDPLDWIDKSVSGFEKQDTGNPSQKGDSLNLGCTPRAFALLFPQIFLLLLPVLLLSLVLG